MFLISSIWLIFFSIFGTSRSTKISIKATFGLKYKTFLKNFKLINDSDYTLFLFGLFANLADFYLNMNRTDENELYHKAHENVAVMFASLTDLSIDESNILIDLNEIICEFDKLLFEPSFVCRIEKIKIAGTTYMAACGLDAHHSRDSMRSMDDDDDHVVKVMAEFAAEMMQVIDRLNVEAFPNTKPYKYVDCNIDANRLVNIHYFRIDSSNRPLFYLLFTIFLFYRLYK